MVELVVDARSTNTSNAMLNDRAYVLWRRSAGFPCSLVAIILMDGVFIPHRAGAHSRDLGRASAWLRHAWQCCALRHSGDDCRSLGKQASPKKLRGTGF